MLVSLDWIKDYVKLPDDMDKKKMAYDVTMSTVEVEDTIELAKQFDKLVVGEIKEVNAHPNADSLRVCMVDIGGGEIKLIAVDGFRMAIRTEKIDYHGEDISFIVPAKTMSEIMKLSLEENDEEESLISIGIGKHHIVFEVNNYSVISRLLEGEFLNYKSTIPAFASTTVEVDTREFIDSIERTSLIITDKTKSLISCVFDTGYINISSITAIGTANDKVSADIEGNRVEIGFNNRYLLDALKSCNTDRVKINLSGSVSPILILPTEGDSFMFLVLPVRLKKND